MKVIKCLSYLILLVLILSSCNNPNSNNFTYYTVTFDSQGGTDVPSQEVLAGNVCVRPDAPIREGYAFSGWYQDISYTAIWDFAVNRVNENITLYARWDELNSDLIPTESLIYELDETTNSYIVRGVGEETNVIIPSTYNNLPVTSIAGTYGRGAFARKDIKTITIPDSIIEIGQNTFNNCRDLEEINISSTSNLQIIGRNAFSGCSNLRSIYIPTNVNEIGDSAFNNCGALEFFIVAEDNLYYTSINGHLILKDNLELIKGVNNAIIPDGITKIHQAAFRRINNLETLTIPLSVKEIDNYIISDSTITTINYLGTETMWNEIVKGNLWNLGKEDISINYINN